MAKAKLAVPILLASIMCLGSAANAGVALNGGTYLQAQPLTQASEPAQAGSGICSYWYSASTTAQRRATIISNYPDFVFGDSTVSIFIEHVPVGSTMRLHVLIAKHPMADAYLDFYSLTPLPYFSGSETPSAQHSVIAYWDAGVTSGKLIMQLDGRQMTADTTLSTIVGTPFQATTNGAGWTVGAKLIQGSGGSLVPTQFFRGSLDQVFCHFDDNPPSGPNDYQKLTTPGLIPPAYVFPVSFIYDPATRSVTGPFAEPLGPFCTGVFTPAAPFPYVCLRGNHVTFPQNDGLGAFTVIPANGLTDATYSPWDLGP